MIKQMRAARDNNLNAFSDEHTSARTGKQMEETGDRGVLSPESERSKITTVSNDKFTTVDQHENNGDNNVHNDNQNEDDNDDGNDDDNNEDINNDRDDNNDSNADKETDEVEGTAVGESV